MLHLSTSARVSGSQAKRLANSGNRVKGLRGDPRRAIHEDEILCLICGAPFRQLSNTHLRAHGLSSLDYKRRFGYNLRTPLMCRALQRLYSDRATRRGLADFIQQRPILIDLSLRGRGGRHQVALEERLARQDAWRLRRAGASSGRNGPRMTQ